MRNLYLIRHGTPDFNDGIKLCIGRTDIDIGEEGKEEAIKLRDFFQNKDISNIYSSPLKRCIHTAKIIADGRKAVITEDGLVEIYMGCWEGVPLKDIEKDLGDEPADGEKRVDALRRMKEAVGRIMNNTDGDVILVSHAGVNCAFLADIIGRDIRTSRALKQPCGSYNHFIFDGKRFSLVEMGCLPQKQI